MGVTDVSAVKGLPDMPLGAVDTTTFRVPVDTEQKSTVIRPWLISRPHMVAFHLSWIGFFCAFFSSFAPAALLPVIRDNLNLTKQDIGNAGVASVCGALGARILIGNFLDTYGPRFGISLFLGLTAPAVFCMALVTDSAGFIVARLFIGFSLATFVACQFWVGSMFNTKIVGTSNAIAGGWGNMGGGATALIMPLIYDGIVNSGTFAFIAWRWAFFVPAFMQIVIMVVILLIGQDLPGGQYAELRKSGAMHKPTGWVTWKVALSNYRSWCLCLAYGYCFGVELSCDNVLPQYLFDEFTLSITTAGYLGSIFGLMNIFTRATGGIASDMLAKYFGMRGRLWGVWVGQTIAGALCLVLGYMQDTLGGTIGVVVVFSIFCQASCGLNFGVVPFVSKRSYGSVAGLVGAGGNAGSAVTQAAFFTSTALTVPEGFRWMGVMIMGVTLVYTLIYFPMWGGVFFPAKKGVTEEDYYLAEYSAEEKASGMHSASLKFAYESRSQRGYRRNAADSKAANGTEVAHSDSAHSMKPAAVEPGKV